MIASDGGRSEGGFQGRVDVAATQHFTCSLTWRSTR